MTPQELQKVLDEKTIDLEGRLIKDGVRKAIGDRQNALHELVTLQGSDYAHAVLKLNKAIDHAEALLLQ
jgi:hypothetical protein